MLSKHLYRIDEVVAALQWCILKGRVMESAFWAMELEESDAAENLQIAVQRAWLYGFGCHALAWLPRLLVKEGLVDTAMGIARGASRRDSSVLAILCLTPQEDRVGGGACPDGLSEKEQFLYRAAVQGKVAILWDWLAQEETLPMDMLRRIRADFPEIQDLSISQKERAALAAAIAAMPAEEYKESAGFALYSDTPAEIEEATASWKAKPNIRKRRVYPIPPSCLHGATDRGGLEKTVSTEIELTRRFEAALAKSPFWSSRYAEAMKSDDGREEFFDTYFPFSGCDIPDEWPASVRSLSHGPGPVPPGAASWTLGRWIRTWFGPIPSRLVWNGVEKAARSVDENYEWDTHGSAWEAIQEGLCDPGQVSWNYRPAKKKVVPAS